MKAPFFALLVLLIPIYVEAQQVEDTPLGIKAQRAFPKLRIRRPVVITNANDGSDRVFIVTQQGVIHVIPNDQGIERTQKFLDIESRVVYKDKENEEGLLGLAFHPNFKENGEFILYYTTADAPHTSVVSRFRVTGNDPNKADPNSEEELLRIKQPFWNHNGGGIAFGPDGYLYVALGDGGAGGDPLRNGQNLETLLGSILRIDVDNKDEGMNYAIPKDNPFAGRDRARGEIWAYGLRNVWGMSFDSGTGKLWAADVGQNIWEEIDIIVRGGNYGWNLREAKHKFEKTGVGPRADLIEPIWEYHHDIGKSITGGFVYRGKKLPELEGCFIYADYISGKLWALKYDDEKGEVIANYQLQSFKNAPIMSIGQDEQGEAYLTDSFGYIYELVRSDG